MVAHLRGDLDPAHRLVTEARTHYEELAYAFGEGRDTQAVSVIDEELQLVSQGEQQGLSADTTITILRSLKANC